MKNREKILLHPIRMRIIQMIAQHQTMTVAALAEALGDIPRSTIYHHVGILHENQIVQVVREKKVRGVYEREYGFNYESMTVPAQEREGVVASMLLKLVADFSTYFAGPNPDPVRDQFFFSVNTFLLTDEELQSCITELYGVLQKYLNYPSHPARKTRTLSIISSPSMENPAASEEDSP